MPHCETLRLPDGTVAHLRLSGPRKKPCSTPGCRNKADFLCDWIMGARRSCSKPICSVCRTSHGTIDYCPQHEEMRKAKHGIFPERPKLAGHGFDRAIVDDPKREPWRDELDRQAKAGGQRYEDYFQQFAPPPDDDDAPPETFGFDCGGNVRSSRTGQRVDVGERPKPRNTKYEHVRTAPQTRPHGCHWPGCEAQVPPAMWGCKSHWFRLPKPLRDRLWKAYKAGQEERGDPSPEYLEAAEAIQAWIREHAGKAWR